MKEFLGDSAMYFYTDLISIICALIASVVGFIMRKQYRELRLMFLYPCASIFQMFNVYFLQYILKIESNFYYGLSNSVFLLIEFLCFYFYYSALTKRNHLLTAIRIVPLIYLTLFILKCSEEGINSILENPLYFTQALMILTLAVIYLFFLFSDKPKHNLLNEPSFWITIGALVYFLCTVPIFVAFKYIFNNDGFKTDLNLYSINYICYSLFFLFITRAYLCKATAKP